MKKNVKHNRNIISITKSNNTMYTPTYLGERRPGRSTIHRRAGRSFIRKKSAHKLIISLYPVESNLQNWIFKDKIFTTFMSINMQKIYVTEVEVAKKSTKTKHYGPLTSY